MEYSNALIQERFPQPFGYNDLDSENQELYGCFSL
jgi:hypothetical protein